MQRLLAATLFMILVAAPAASASAQLRFSPPGTFAAEASRVAGGSWLIMVFDNTPASFSFVFDAAGSVENQTWVYPARIYNHSYGANPAGYPSSSSRDVPAGAQYRISMPSTGRASLFIEAEKIGLETGGVQGNLAEKPDASGVKQFKRPQDKEDRIYRNVQPPGNDAVVQYVTGTSFNLTVAGARHIEWHGAHVDCKESEWCPDGGGTSSKTVSTPIGYNMTSEQFSYEIATAGLNGLRGEGALDFALLGGSQLGFAVTEGRFRLPLASVDGKCSGCILPENQTLTVSGDLQLAALQLSDKGKLAAGLDGSVTEARLDESAIDPNALLGATAGVAAVALGLVLLKVFGLLFTRWHDRDILDVPRRRLVYETIAKHPGAGFRELTRLTGLAIGTVRHHLDVLLRHGKIVERQQGSTLRFFENHGKYDGNWPKVAILRDEQARIVHEWLAAHPDTPQNEVLLALEGQGFSRTATQRRLQRLVAAGLATVQERGRFKIYRAA